NSETPVSNLASSSSGDSSAIAGSIWSISRRRVKAESCETALARAPEKVDKNGMSTSRTLTRRTFIRTAAAATSSAPFILPSRIWAAEVKPNARVALGFIGMGKQNRGLMSDFLGRKETQTVAVCDVDTHRREHAKKTVEDHYAQQTE